jgi:hypothetical protein
MPVKTSASPEGIAKLVSAVTLLPRLWVALMIVVAVAAAVNLGTTEAGAFRWHVAVGPVSLIAIGLIWLPAALSVLFVAGGSIKAAGIEAATDGILAADEFFDDLANLRTTADPVGGGAPDPAVARRMDTAIDRIVSRHPFPESVLSEERLNREAREYEQIRGAMASSDERTMAMTQLVSEVRIRAAAAPSAAMKYAPVFMRSAREGDRIVGLAIAEGAPSADLFDDVLRIFSTSASAFEQYHSLLALSEVAPVLGPVQRQHAIAVLQSEMADPRQVGLMNDPYIPSTIRHVLSLMN